MKYILFLSLTLTTSAFAIDFNKVTGTFDGEEKTVVGEDSVTAAAYGSFNLHQDQSRGPASVDAVTEEASVGINDVTGTFH